MIKTLYFASHNLNKKREIEEILGIKVKLAGFEVDEIQSLDPKEVAVKKARAYYEKLKKPIFVEDISFSISALNGLPGPYIDSFLKTLGNDGIVDLIKGKKDRGAIAQATVVFVLEEGKEKIFIGKVVGTIPDKPKGEGFGWDPIFIPEGEKKTFGEMTLEEKNRYSMRAKAFKKFKDWLYSQT